MIRPLAAAGRLPNLAAWMGEGQARLLPSTTPPMSFPAWSSFATGVGPGAHGLFDFTQKVPGAYRLRFVNAADRVGRSLFARASQAGARVLALGMPATWPPEPVNGLLVPGFDSPVSFGSDPDVASDPTLYREIAARVGDWMTPDLAESASTADWHERAAARLPERVAQKTRFALEALRLLRARDRAPDVVCVVFAESDTVAHHFWRDHDAGSPRHDPSASPARRGALPAVYAALDAACGALRHAMGDEALCVVLSDHGSGSASDRIVHVNRHLAECGLLARSKASPTFTRDALARRARDLALRAVPPKVLQRVFRRARGGAARLESAARFGGFDWNHTRAFSEEANTQPGVWLNLLEREVAGVVSASDLERTRRDVIDALLAWKLPGGDPVVARALPREEVHAGPFVQRAPDVVFDLAPDAGHGLSLVPTPWNGDFRGSVRTLAPEEWGGGRGRGMNGVHRPDGILLAVGADHDRLGVVSRLQDLAPAALRAAGLPWDDDAAPPRHERPYTDAEEAEVAARLRALGYLA